MFNRVLGLIGENERVELYEKQTIVKPSGGTSTTWNMVGKVFCNIQSTGSSNKVEGMTLNTSESGDVITAVYNLYTRSPIKEGQRVVRIEDDGLTYEIRNVEHNGKKTILEHYKGYLTRIDNQ